MRRDARGVGWDERQWMAKEVLYTTCSTVATNSKRRTYFVVCTYRRKQARAGAGFDTHQRATFAS